VFAVVALLVVLLGPLTPTSASPANTGVRDLSRFRVPGAFPWGTAFDRSGRVWVAMPGCDPDTSCPISTPPGKLGLFDPTTATWDKIVQLPSGYGQPLFVALDASGNVWFTMPVTNTIGVFDPDDDAVHQWAVPTRRAGPWDLAFDHSGDLWFTEHFLNKIGEFDPDGDKFVREIATPASGSNPYGIAIDSSNDVWFTENADSVALIGEFTRHGVLKEYKIRNTSTTLARLTPHLITIDHSGNIWWSEGWAHAIATLNVSEARPATNDGVTEYPYAPPCSSCESHTSGIAVDARGFVWFDDSLQNVLGSMPIGGGDFSFYKVPGANAHPHDGLNIDSKGRIWLTEEYANKLTVAVPSYTGGSAGQSRVVIATDGLQVVGAHLLSPVTLRCLGSVCSGFVRLIQTVSSSKTMPDTMTVTTRSTVALASAHYRLAARSGSVALTLTSIGRRLLSKAAARLLTHLTLSATVKGVSIATRNVSVTEAK